MTKIKLLIFIVFIFSIITGCQSVSKKIDEKTAQEEKELSKWLNQSELELKAVYGQPNDIKFLKNKNKYYFYNSIKFKIKCERRFEINPKNIIIGFSSKNCF